jgi:hypothetical protein
MGFDLFATSSLIGRYLRIPAVDMFFRRYFNRSRNPDARETGLTADDAAFSRVARHPPDG